MKRWTVYYKIKGFGRKKSHGCDTRPEAAKFIATIKKAGHSYSSLKWNGKDALSGTTLELDREADRILNGNPN